MQAAAPRSQDMASFTIYPHTVAIGRKSVELALRGVRAAREPYARYELYAQAERDWQ